MFLVVPPDSNIVRGYCRDRHEPPDCNLPYRTGLLPGGSAKPLSYGQTRNVCGLFQGYCGSNPVLQDRLPLHPAVTRARQEPSLLPGAAVTPLYRPDPAGTRARQNPAL